MSEPRRGMNRNSKRVVKACHFNARSLRNKFEDLEALAAMDQYDIIGVTESWLDTSNRDFIAEYNLPGYTIFSCERENRTGGGVILYVHNNLQPVSMKTESIKNVDTVFIELKSKSSKVVIGVIYGPPGQLSVTDHALSNLISEISCRSESVIMGDFNLPVTRWGDPLHSHTGQDLYTSLLESDLYQHVNNPTRVNNILDLVFSTTENLISEVNVGPVFSSSDHRIVTFNVSINDDKSKDSKEKVPDYQRANFNRLRSILNDADWNEILTATNIDKSWQIFTTILNNAINSCVPYRNQRSANRSKPKWWNSEIKNSLVLKKISIQ